MFKTVKAISEDSFNTLNENKVRQFKKYALNNFTEQ